MASAITGSGQLASAPTAYSGSNSQLSQAIQTIWSKEILFQAMPILRFEQFAIFGQDARSGGNGELLAFWLQRTHPAGRGQDFTRRPGLIVEALSHQRVLRGIALVLVVVLAYDVVGILDTAFRLEKPGVEPRGQ